MRRTTERLRVALPMFLTLALLGCWGRAQRVSLTTGDVYLCSGALARVRVAPFDHVAYRNCSIQLVPPFYECSPEPGFGGILEFQSSSVAQELEITLLDFLITTDGTEHRPCAWPGVPPEETLRLSAGGLARVLVRWCGIGPFVEGTVCVRAEVRAETKTEVLSCTAPVEFVDPGFVWLHPMTPE